MTRTVLLLVAVAVAAALGDQLPASSHTSAAPPGARSGPRATRLDPALASALRRAAADAAAEGIEIVVDSGVRTRAYQQQLLDEAIAKYGSEAEAARWVAPPNRSAHVSGDAVDIGPAQGAAWLTRHGAAYGLCRIYANEPWHFERRSRASEQGCPSMYADATHDPRMQP